MGGGGGGMETNHSTLPNLGRALWTLRNFARDSRRDQKGLMKGEDLTLLKLLLLEAAITVSLKKKITSEVKFTVQKQ